jgi:hypothetical protein
VVVLKALKLADALVLLHLPNVPKIVLNVLLK